MPSQKKSTKTPNKQTLRSKSSSSTFKTSKFSKNQLLAFVLVFAAIGGYLIYHSFAAAPVVASLQGEAMHSGCLAGCGSSNIQDSAASGGQAVRVTTNTSLSTYAIIPSNATNLSVVARASSCSGGWPMITISIGNNTTLPSTKVASTIWKTYSTSSNLAAGTYLVNATISNNGVINSACSRHLDLDAITFYGPNTAPPPPGTPPPVGSGTVGVPYTCNGRVSGLKIKGTGHDPAALVKLNSGCTGSLSFDVTIDPTGNDGVKVNVGAHDLNIGTSSITCQTIPIDPVTHLPVNPVHQDGVQVQGGSNVTFHNLTVNCPTSWGMAGFFIDGKDFAGISNVICDSCNLHHYFYGATFTGPAPGSGVSNSIIHAGRYGYFLGDTVAPVHGNNAYVSP